MKFKIIGHLIVMVGLLLLLAGCASSRYQVQGRTETKDQKTVSVQVPLHTTEAEMKAWGLEIQDNEKVVGKGFEVKFFTEMPNQPHTIVGSYNNGVVSVYADVFK